MAVDAQSEISFFDTSRDVAAANNFSYVLSTEPFVSGHRRLVVQPGGLTLGSACILLLQYLLRNYYNCTRYEDNEDNTVEKKSSVFALIRLCWLPSPPARACGQ